jgi:hypothetical protein
MWASLLRGAGGRDIDNLATNTYPFLGFDELQSLALDVEIDDKAWLPNEEKEIAEAGRETLEELPLLEWLEQDALNVRAEGDERS